MYFDRISGHGGGGAAVQSVSMRDCVDCFNESALSFRDSNVWRAEGLSVCSSGGNVGPVDGTLVAMVVSRDIELDGHVTCTH